MNTENPTFEGMEVIKLIERIEALERMFETCPECKGWGFITKISFWTAHLSGVPCKRCQESGKVLRKSERKI